MWEGERGETTGSRKSSGGGDVKLKKKTIRGRGSGAGRDEATSKTKER